MVVSLIVILVRLWVPVAATSALGGPRLRQRSAAQPEGVGLIA
jgi:hypothetical protein